jgi:hypothetical protein
MTVSPWVSCVLTQHTTKPGGVPPNMEEKHVMEFEEQNVDADDDGTSANADTSV